MRGEPGSVRSAGGSAISRRSLLRGAVAAGVGIGAASLTGCSVPVLNGLTASREEPGTVQFWNLFGGGDGVRMQQMLDGYQRSHPAVTLVATTFAWGNPYYTKLSLATVGDKPPDVAVAHLTRMRNLVAGGLLQELRPDDLDRFGLTRDKFNPQTWDAGLVDGKVYAIPIDTHPFVMFYNTEICQKAGLMDGDKIRPIDQRGGVRGRDAQGQGGHRRLRRGGRGDQRERHPVADLPVAVRTARREDAGG